MGSRGTSRLRALALLSFVSLTAAEGILLRQSASTGVPRPGRSFLNGQYPSFLADKRATVTVAPASLGGTDDANVECSMEDLEKQRAMWQRGGATGPVVSSRAKALFAFTYIAYVALYFARKPMSVVKPVLQTDLGMSRDALSMLDTSLLGSYAIGQLLIGQLNRILTRRQMLSMAFLVSGAATAGLGLVSSFGAMAALSGVAGFFAACVNPLMVIFISELFPASMRASVVGLWQTSQQAGGIAANNFASLLLSMKDWRHVFIASGLVVASFGVPILFVLKSATRKAPAGPRGGAAANTPFPSSSSSSEGESEAGAATGAAAAAIESPRGGSLGETLRTPGVISVAAAYTLVKMARYCLMLWLPTFFTQKVGMDPAKAGMLASIFDAGGVGGGVCAGLATDLIAGGRMILVTLPMCLLAGLSFLAWGLSANGGEVVNMVIMAIAGFLIAGPDGILGGAASKNLVDYSCQSGKLAPAVSGFVNGMASFGVIAMSAFTSKIVTAFGWTGLFVLLSAMMAAAGLCVSWAAIVEWRYFNLLKR